ncbi:hypothetical protein [Bacillus sp. WP8]|nr:hypothetical protein [Bacillus sp. WP8]
MDVKVNERVDLNGVFDWELFCEWVDEGDEDDLWWLLLRNSGVDEVE